MGYRIEFQVRGKTWPAFRYRQTEAEARHALAELQESGEDFRFLTLIERDRDGRERKIWRLRR
jgi:hypothetical protein